MNKLLRYLKKVIHIMWYRSIREGKSNRLQNPAKRLFVYAVLNKVFVTLLQNIVHYVLSINT